METRASWLGRCLRRLTIFSCYAYLAAVLGTLLALRWIGDDYWLTGVAMYLPRVLFGLPCLVLTPLVLWFGMPRLLWTQLVAALLVIFPLMGFVLPRPVASAGAQPMRVLSFNIAHCEAGDRAITSAISRYTPDVVLLQEVCWEPKQLVARLRETYPEVHVTHQFLLASRYPLRSLRNGAPAEQLATSESERYAAYELQTPFGPVAFYNLHPLTPRWAFYAVRGMRVRTSLRNGTFWRGGASEVPLRQNFAERERHLAAAARAAAAEHIPHVLAGDTNLTGLSPVFERYLGDYSDGFQSASWGFGYTFPSGEPWMRLDRILASRELRFVSFQVGCETASDHRCVFAQIDRR
ncbi:MAG TPA: endonuclease/exonuclease/phosphatase family protein [Polyangiales bacterium]|nr:endonuclease/exonuclease/phosphatase family protein [Polyangiales bacterium]